MLYTLRPEFYCVLAKNSSGSDFCEMISHAQILTFSWCGTAEETHKWRSVTIAAYIMCIGMGIYTLANEEHHGGHNPVCSVLALSFTALLYSLHLQML